MKHFNTFLVAASLVTALGISSPALTATVMQTVVLTQVDPQILATGWRASQIIGAKVYNDAGEEIGSIEDMIITTSGTVPYAVVSVGGFLGMNVHHVVVAAASLEMMDKKLTLHGGTKESLKALPNYEFAS